MQLPTCMRETSAIPASRPLFPNWFYSTPKISSADLQAPSRGCVSTPNARRPPSSAAVQTARVAARICMRSAPFPGWKPSLTTSINLPAARRVFSIGWRDMRTTWLRSCRRPTFPLLRAWLMGGWRRSIWIWWGKFMKRETTSAWRGRRLANYLVSWRFFLRILLASFWTIGLRPIGRFCRALSMELLRSKNQLGRSSVQGRWRGKRRFCSRALWDGQSYCNKIKLFRKSWKNKERKVRT